jgi:hypothetical protein
MRTIPYAAGTAVAAIGATLLLSGSASAAPAGDDRDPVPPGAVLSRCSVDGGEVTPPRITHVEPRENWRSARPATPREPEVHCEAAGPAAGTCAVVVPGRPAGPSDDFVVPARPAESGEDFVVPAPPAEPPTHLDRADGSTRVDERGFTCEGAGVLQTAPRR